MLYIKTINFSTDIIMATFLHGTMIVSVKEAKSLPELNRKCCLWYRRRKSTVDAFVTMEMCESKLLRTAVVRDQPDPVWNAIFIIDVAHETSEILFYINDEFHPGEVPGFQHIGVAKISASTIAESKSVEGWYPIEGISTTVVGGQIFIKIEYIPADQIATKDEVMNAYFDMTSNNSVTLYQDAHCTGNELFDKITLANEGRYAPSSLWLDVEKALKNTKKFIYLADWMFSPDVRLDRKTAGSETIGTLLKKKADEGVIVLVLIWHSRFAGDLDTKTLEYFKDSKVVVERVLREKDQSNIIADQIVKSIYSHHQKIIITDTEVNNSDQRGIMAFIGGYDLTCGRWDTQDHLLFTSGKQEYANDFYQSSADVQAEYGPRLPWHDVHCRLTGPAAQDILRNFEERWKKQVHQRADLLSANRNEVLLDAPANNLDNDKWQVQILRSINEDSADFDPAKLNRLMSKRGRKTEASISRGSVLLVRRAKKFIYIENQYFSGSSFAWLEGKTDKSRHLLPLEIIYKIEEKIRAGQRFAVYIVIPMRPEGKPDKPEVRDSLLNQRRTIHMMYRRIAEVIKLVGSNAHPTDYLNFYCLGKREPDAGDNTSSSASSSPLSGEDKLKKSRRFMIYVHSKMMIVDDSHIIVGSANANQRSMGGNRDTEIAMMGFQSAFNYDGAQLPRGQVHGFRMALWAEHTRCVSDEFLDPSSLECVKKINDLAETNLQKYCQDEVCVLDGHLVKYPINVEINGDITTRSGLASFPDSDVPVFGNKNHALPLRLCT